MNARSSRRGRYYAHAVSTRRGRGRVRGGELRRGWPRRPGSGATPGTTRRCPTGSSTARSLNTSILATSTCYRFANGRFYGWEGVGCCAGHLHARLALRPGRGAAVSRSSSATCARRVDFGLAFDADDGRASASAARRNGTRPSTARRAASCAPTASTRCRADDAFLQRDLAAASSRPLECLIAQDGDGDGILEGEQHNTLDADWFGPVAWLSGALPGRAAGRRGDGRRDGRRRLRRAGAARSSRRGRQEHRRSSSSTASTSSTGPTRSTPKPIDSGTGCHIDQVFGQSWACQVGLGRVLARAGDASRRCGRCGATTSRPTSARTARRYKPGRWYAMAGEAGLLMCTCPRGDWDYEQAKGKGARLGSPATSTSA